jgi:Lon protease-like protein
MKAKTLTCGVWLAALLCAPGILPAQTPGATAGLPATIPIFPLPAATLFPNGTHLFYIFEPRYRAMVADALKGDRIIGMMMLQPGFEADYEGRPPIFPIGCAGLITDYEELPDGQYNIALSGLVKFRVTGEDNSRSYRMARVIAMPEELDAQETVALAKERQRLEDLLLALFDRLGMELPPAASDKQAVDVLSQYLPIDPLSRQRLLEQDDPLSRAVVLGKLLEAIVKKQ